MLHVLQSSCSRPVRLALWPALGTFVVSCSLINAYDEIPPATSQGGAGASGGHDMVSTRCSWAKRLGGDGTDWSEAIATDSSGNIFIAGHFEKIVDFGCPDSLSAGNDGSDIFVLKLDPDGECIWRKGFGDDDSQMGAAPIFVELVVDKDGDVLVTGSFVYTVDFDCGELFVADGHDIFLVKLSGQTGECMWNKHFGGEGRQDARGLAVDKSGNVILTGSFAQSLTLSVVGSGGVGGSGGSVTGSGGCPPLTSNGQDGDNDIFLAKFDAAGTCLWNRSFGDENKQCPSDPDKECRLNVATDPQTNDVIFNGSTAGSVNFNCVAPLEAHELDVFLVKYDPQGQCLWYQYYHGDGTQHPALNVAVDSAQNIVHGGSFSDTMEFTSSERRGGLGPTTAKGKYDAFLTRLASNGEPAWLNTYGLETKEQDVHSLVVDSAGNIVMSGRFEGPVDYGCGSLVGYRHFLVNKYDSNGACIWSTELEKSNTKQPRITAAIAPGNEIVIVGYFDETLRFGDYKFTAKGAADIFVAKFAP